MSASDKEKRIAELEAELEELKRPVFKLLRIFGKDVNVTTKKRHAPIKRICRRVGGENKFEFTRAVPLIEYTED